MKQIRILKPTSRAYGKEYPVQFINDGRIVHRTVAFDVDLPWINRSYTQDFKGVNPTTKYKSIKKLLQKKYE